MIFALSLAAAAIAAGAIARAARQARPGTRARQLCEDAHYEVVGGRWDGLRVDRPPIGGDEAIRLTVSRDGDAVVSTRVCREETALALASIAYCIAEGIEEGEEGQKQ